MRYLKALFLAPLLVLALALPAAAQAQPEKSADNDLEQQVLKELAKFEFKAKRDVPAADSIFVDKGRLQEAMYKLSLSQGGVLLKSGKTTKVSSVKIMEHGIQIFLETDKCAMISMAADTEAVQKMAVPKLVELSKATLGALFTAVEVPAGSAKPADGAKPADTAKPADAAKAAEEKKTT